MNRGHSSPFLHFPYVLMYDSCLLDKQWGSRYWNLWPNILKWFQKAAFWEHFLGFFGDHSWMFIPMTELHLFWCPFHSCASYGAATVCYWGFRFCQPLGARMGCLSVFRPLFGNRCAEDYSYEDALWTHAFSHFCGWATRIRTSMP